MKQYTIEHLIYKIGGNAEENWNLLSSSKPYHIFFHLSSYPSCFVILETPETQGKYPTSNIIETVANECKNHTKYKNLRNLKVDYTFCYNVIKGEKPGQVYFQSNRKVNQIKI
jgi:predicted ribosome quality control (RQC) complex YloA/Tae2 family protein